MAYNFDSRDRALIINGFESGIAGDPYSGIADMRNVNLISIPGEASVNFATALSSNLAVTTAGTVSSADSSAKTITFTGATGFISGNAISFSVVTVGGLSINTVYWLGLSSGNTYFVYTDFNRNNLASISGTGTGTFTVFNMGQPRYMVNADNGYIWMQDINGLVWTTAVFITWTYTGNVPEGNLSTGNGLIFFRNSDGNNYIFAFDANRINYVLAPSGGGSVGTWVYGWDPFNAATGVTNYMKTLTAGTIHAGIIGPDNKLYYCDGPYIGRFYQTSRNTAFDPTNVNTYIQDQSPILPATDVAQCIAPLGNNLLIGGKLNIIYPWDTFSITALYPIFLAEYNVQSMVTINTNTYALVGNRGRIYYTNGSQAVLFVKIPDHLSGTVEPYFTWGGFTSQKNQLYFSVLATSNGGSAINQYGGVWAIDIDTKALRLTNQLSYGTYAGFASVIIPNFSTNPAGTGLYIGWNNNSSVYGIDTTISTPYTGSQAYIISDLIPIGTYNMPRDFERVEYRLTRPMVSGESVTMYYRLIFDSSDTGWIQIFTDNIVGAYSNSQPVSFKNAQWLQMKVVLNSTASSPSYTRLKEWRITGLQGQGPQQQITI